MKVKVISVNKHNNEYNVQKDSLNPLEINKEYDFEVVGNSLNYFDRYELMYSDGRKSGMLCIHVESLLAKIITAMEFLLML